MKKFKCHNCNKKWKAEVHIDTCPDCGTRNIGKLKKEVPPNWVILSTLAIIIVVAIYIIF